MPSRPNEGLSLTADAGPPLYELATFDAWRPGARALAERSIRRLEEEASHCHAALLSQSPVATAAAADVVVTLDTAGERALVAIVSFRDFTDRAIVPCFDSILQGAEFAIPPGRREIVELRFLLRMSVGQ